MTPFQPVVTPSHRELAELLRCDNAEQIAGCGADFTLDQLRAVHQRLFADTEHDFHAGRLRTLTVHAGPQDVPPAREVRVLMALTFRQGLPHPLCVVDWTAYVLTHIHPFFDGNRRACWAFANHFLAGQGFNPIDWEGFRPYWEHVVLVPHDRKMALMMPELVRFHRDSE